MVALAGSMNRQQAEAIEYLRMENRILREKLGHKRLILDDSQRRRLAQAAARVPRDVLRDVGTLFSPDTLLKWHRWLVARKYDGSVQRGKRGPAPSKRNMIRDLVKRMCADNPSWGYGRVHGELRALGYDIHRQTSTPGSSIPTRADTFSLLHCPSAWARSGVPAGRSRPRPEGTGRSNPLAKRFLMAVINPPRTVM